MVMSMGRFYDQNIGAYEFMEKQWDNLCMQWYKLVRQSSGLIYKPCRHVDMQIFLIGKRREFEFSPTKDESQFHWKD